MVNQHIYSQSPNSEGSTDEQMRGFTLIELLTTIAIVSIITMISVPLYQSYALRAKIGGDLLLMDPVKKLVAEEYAINDTWAVNNKQASAHPPSAYQGKYLQSVEVTNAPVDGSILLSYDTSALPALVGANTIIFYPTTTEQIIHWSCDAGTMKDKYRPYQCRSGS